MLIDSSFRIFNKILDAYLKEAKAQHVIWDGNDRLQNEWLDSLRDCPEHPEHIMTGFLIKRLTAGLSVHQKQLLAHNDWNCYEDWGIYDSKILIQGLDNPFLYDNLMNAADWFPYYDKYARDLIWEYLIKDRYDICVIMRFFQHLCARGLSLL